MAKSNGNKFSFKVLRGRFILSTAVCTQFNCVTQYRTFLKNGLKSTESVILFLNPSRA